MKLHLLPIFLTVSMAPSALAQVQQEAYLKHSHPDNSDIFGAALDIDGDTAVVAVRFDDSSSVGTNGDPSDNSGFQSGAVIVYRRSGSIWTQEAFLKASNTDEEDEFGLGVSISGDTIAVGARYEDSSAIGIDGDQTLNDRTDSGAVYIFVRSGTTWTQEAYLKASNPEQDDWFGGSVSLDGDLLVVGASGEDGGSAGVNGDETDNSEIASGAVYVFRRAAGVWAQEAYLKGSHPDSQDYFGFSVAVHGNLIGVGAFGDDSSATGIDGDANDNSFSNSGSVTIFEKVGGSWGQAAYVKPLVAQTLDSFGYALDLSGDSLITSSVSEDGADPGVNGNASDNSLSSSGAAYIFRRTAGVWAQEAYLKAHNPGESDTFGFSASLSGDTAIVGATLEDSDAQVPDGDPTNDNAERAGAAYIYQRTATGWTYVHYLKAANAEADDRFGAAVAISGGAALVSATRERSGDPLDPNNNLKPSSGAAYVFDLGLDPCGDLFDDIYENNQTCSNAPTLAPGSYSLFASKTDWDFFAVDLADGETLDVSITGSDPGVDFGGVIWDPLDVDCGIIAGVPLVLGSTGPDTAMTYFNKTGAAQTVLVEVYVPTSQMPDCGMYDLGLSVTPALGSSFCTGVPNSSGQVADLYATGSPDALDNDVTLQVCGGPPMEFVFIIGSFGMADPGVIPGGLYIGELCVGAGSPIARFVDTHNGGGPTGATQSLGMLDVDGHYSIYIDMGNLPVNSTPGMNADFATEGMDFHFQAFYRDGPGVANFSSGLTIPWVTLP